VPGRVLSWVEARRPPALLRLHPVVDESLARGAVAWVPSGLLPGAGRLGFCPAPGRWRLPAFDLGRRLAEDLASLAADGPATLVVLLEEDEMARVGLGRLLDEAARVGLEVLHFPIRDNGPPESFARTALLVQGILERLASGRRVVVHCLAGVGRSGTVAAACLVAAGEDPDRALEAIRQERPLAATAPGQEQFVREFALLWGRGGGPRSPGAVT